MLLTAFSILLIIVVEIGYYAENQLPLSQRAEIKKESEEKEEKKAE